MNQIIYAQKDIDNFGFVIAEFNPNYPVVENVKFVHDLHNVVAYNHSEVGLILEYLGRNKYCVKTFEVN